MGPLFYMGRVDRHPEGLIVGLMFWLTFMLANLLRFDFRGDLDLIETLKAMPVRPTALVLAELVAPIVVLALCQGALLASVAYALRTDMRVIGLIVLFTLPISALLIALENLIFLVFPVRAVAVSPGDLQGFGRQMLVLLIKTIVLLIFAGIAGGAGALMWWMNGKSISTGIVTALTLLALEFVLMIPLLVIAFRRFDPSVDTPA
jgi:hypothetical protein